MGLYVVCECAKHSFTEGKSISLRALSNTCWIRLKSEQEYNTGSHSSTAASEEWKKRLSLIPIMNVERHHVLHLQMKNE